MIENWSAFSSFVMGTVGFLIYALLTFLQAKEVLRPADWFTRYRVLVLFLVVLGLATASPSIIYQYWRMIGEEHQLARSVASITTRISQLAFAILFLLFYFPRRRD